MNNNFFTEKQLKEFLALKKAAKSDFVQYLILMFFIVSAFISNLFYQSLTSALLMGAICRTEFIPGFYESKYYF